MFNQALDTLGNTKWKINKKVLSLVDRIWANGGRIGGLVDREDVRSLPLFFADLLVVLIHPSASHLLQKKEVILIPTSLLEILIFSHLFINYKRYPFQKSRKGKTKKNLKIGDGNPKKQLSKIMRDIHKGVI